MNTDLAAIEPTTTRLGLLQRGRGHGFVQALRAGTAAHDDLLHCLLSDPRVDRQDEARGRYYGELLVALDLPLLPLLAGLRGANEPRLGHEALAAAWRLGHGPTRNLLADEGAAEPVIAGISACLWSAAWATRVQLPPRAAAVWLRLELEHADSTCAARRPPSSTALATVPLDELLELARGPRAVRRDRLLGELCARGDDTTRDRLLAVASDDVVYTRVQLAARALGLLGDERLLPLAEDLFGREDVFADPPRRLRGEARMRRACLAEYVLHLPSPVALQLARRYHPRGGYFTQVAGDLFQHHATTADRIAIEAFVAARQSHDGGVDVIGELEALGRIADARSAPLLAEVAQQATYSQARQRAVQALAAMPELPLAQHVLQEALWDCEDETAAIGCTFATLPSVATQDRIAVLAASPVVDGALAARALQRLRHVDQ